MAGGRLQESIRAHRPGRHMNRGRGHDDRIGVTVRRCGQRGAKLADERQAGDCSGKESEAHRAYYGVDAGGCKHQATETRGSLRQ